jgi:serine/threonine protein kinase
VRLGDRYGLGEGLGHGGMAEVHRAHDLLLDREVAVEVLRETVDDHDRARFMQEARTLAGLSHINLVTVLDAGRGRTPPPPISLPSWPRRLLRFLPSWEDLVQAGSRPASPVADHDVRRPARHDGPPSP